MLLFCHFEAKKHKVTSSPRRSNVNVQKPENVQMSQAPLFSARILYSGLHSVDLKATRKFGFHSLKRLPTKTKHLKRFCFQSLDSKNMSFCQTNGLSKHFRKKSKRIFQVSVFSNSVSSPSLEPSAWARQSLSIGVRRRNQWSSTRCL